MSAPTKPRVWDAPPAPTDETRGLGDRYGRSWRRRAPGVDRWDLVGRASTESATYLQLYRQGFPLRDITADLPDEAGVSGGVVALWAVDHPGIGVLGYASEWHAREAAGTAGILLTRGSADEPWQQVAL